MSMSVYISYKLNLFDAQVLIMLVHIYMNVNKLRDRQIFGF